MLAALAGVMVWRVGAVDFAGVVALLAFLAATAAEVYLLKEQPDKRWYDARATAESVKTLAWRYAVGGGPFYVGVEADNLFADRLEEVLEEMPTSAVTPAQAVGPQVTKGMRDVRKLPLPDRRDTYVRGRLEDQATWYSEKAADNERMANDWAVALIVIEIAGAGLALLKVTGVVAVDVLGLTGALVAAGAAWVSIKQYRTLARAYSVAAHELGIVAIRAGRNMGEDAWAAFVDDAEEAISREHTLWRASHK